MKIVRIVLIVLFLMGCQQMEHRSEAMVRVPLPALPHEAIQPTILWSNAHSAGAGKHNNQLGIAINKTTLFIADHKGKLLSLDRKSGKVNWSVTTLPLLSGGPSVVGDAVFLGTEDGQVASYEISTGALLWKTSVSTPVLAAPRAKGKTLFVNTLGGELVALDLKTGEKKWQYSVSIPPLILRQLSSPVFFEKDVIVGFANGRLIAFNQLSGLPEWEKELGALKGRSDIQRMVDISSDPIVHQANVYVVGYQGYLAALRAKTGETLWEKEFSSYAGMTLSQQKLFVMDAKGVLFALEADTGKTLWKQEGLMGRFFSTPVRFGAWIIVGDDEGYLHWINASTGEIHGRYLLDSKGIQGKIVVEEDVLFALGRSGKVVAIKNP